MLLNLKLPLGACSSSYTGRRPGRVFPVFLAPCAKNEFHFRAHPQVFHTVCKRKIRALQIPRADDESKRRPGQATPGVEKVKREREREIINP